MIYVHSRATGAQGLNQHLIQMLIFFGFSEPSLALGKTLEADPDIAIGQCGLRKAK